MLLATARFVITTIQRKFLYFFVFSFPKVPRSIGWRSDSLEISGKARVLKQVRVFSSETHLRYRQLKNILQRGDFNAQGGINLF